MSQLIDKLNRVSRAVPQPMGFKTAQPASLKSKILLIVSLTLAEKADSLADYVAGADAVLLDLTKSSRQPGALQGITQSLSDIPWGGWLGEIGEKRLGKMIEAGGDFIVFPAASIVSAVPQDDKVGKILQIDSSLSEGLLKAVNELPVDAVLIGNEQEDSLTWNHLILLKRFAELLSKPLLVSASPTVTADELKAIWEAGVDGVIVEVSTAQPTGKVKELRQVIDDLPSSPPRKREKTEALLPHIGGETGIATEEEEEEEE